MERGSSVLGAGCVHVQIVVLHRHIARVILHISAFNHQIFRLNLHIGEFIDNATQFIVVRGVSWSRYAF